jgi:hypothetical protein
VVAVTAQAQAQEKINPTDPQPTCPMCPDTYIPSSELEAYTRKALDEKLLDQQVRDIDIGNAHIGIGMVHRGRLGKAGADRNAHGADVGRALGFYGLTSWSRLQGERDCFARGDVPIAR